MTMDVLAFYLDFLTSSNCQKQGFRSREAKEIIRALTRNHGIKLIHGFPEPLLTAVLRATNWP
jgi:hypothetical protein